MITANENIIFSMNELVSFLNGGRYVESLIKQEDVIKDEFSSLIDSIELFINNVPETVLNLKTKYFLRSLEVMLNINSNFYSNEENAHSEFHNFILNKRDSDQTNDNNKFLYNFVGKVVDLKLFAVFLTKEYEAQVADLYKIDEAIQLQEEPLIIYITILIKRMIAQEIIKTKLVLNFLEDQVNYYQKVINSIYDSENILENLLKSFKYKRSMNPANNINKEFLQDYQKKKDFVLHYQSYIFYIQIFVKNT